MNINRGINKTLIALMIAALTLIIIGYFIMSLGDRTISIILLVVSYIVLVPVSLLLTSRDRK
jgi:hypothetical protein